MTAENPKPPKKASKSPLNEVGQRINTHSHTHTHTHTQTKDFRAGACAPREGGNHEGGKVSEHL